MKPPKTVKLRRLRKLLRRYGVEIEAGRRHLIFVSPDGTKFPIPYRKDSDDVERSYVNAARRAFRLTPEDGISDEEFYQRKPSRRPRLSE